MIFRIMIFIILLTASLRDIREKEISLITLILCSVISVICVVNELFLQNGELADSLISLAPGALLLFLSLVTREGIGIGDGLITMSVAPVLGVRNTCLSIMAAMILASVVSVALLVLKKGSRTTRLPFVPMIALGVGVTFFA